LSKNDVPLVHLSNGFDRASIVKTLLASCCWLASHYPLCFGQCRYSTAAHPVQTGASSTRLKARSRAIRQSTTSCAGGGQSMVVIFKPTNLSAYFNILPPGRRRRCTSLHFRQPLRGRAASRRYLHDPRLPDAQCARRHETAHYTLDVGLVGATPVGSTRRLNCRAFDSM